MPDNLPELRDIHLNDGVSVWPLGYGWWVIVAGIVLMFIAVKFIIYLYRQSKKLYALRLIKNISAKNIVMAAAQISEVLRRICVYKYPQAVALSGKEWKKFLSEHCRYNIDDKIYNLLINAPFMPEDAKEYTPRDLDMLRDFTLAWIGENL